MEFNSRIKEVNQMIKFIILGLILGAYAGMTIMCLLQINRKDDYNDQ